MTRVGGRTPRRWASQVILGLALFTLTACGSGPMQRAAPPSEAHGAITAERQRLLQITRDQLGSPYRYGGSSPARGFDCSGLVHYSYQRLGVRVPRTVRQQRRYAEAVSSAALLPGDLVFFDTAAKGGHVGIYVGQGRFIHAPSSGGYVREERLDKPYWRQRWIGGGSLLDG